MASEKQIEFIETLEAERGMVIEEIGWDRDMLQHETFGKGRASQVIKELRSIDKEGE